jgi:hypothetical protein
MQMSCEILRRVVCYILTDVSEVLSASITSLIALMMEAESTCETSVNFYHATQLSIKKYSNVHEWRSFGMHLNMCTYLQPSWTWFSNPYFLMAQSWEPNTHAVWEHAVSLLPTIPAIIRLVTSRSLDRPVAGERRHAGRRPPRFLPATVCGDNCKLVPVLKRNSL